MKYRVLLPVIGCSRKWLYVYKDGELVQQVRCSDLMKEAVIDVEPPCTLKLFRNDYKNESIPLPLAVRVFKLEPGEDECFDIMRRYKPRKLADPPQPDPAPPIEEERNMEELVDDLQAGVEID